MAPDVTPPKGVPERYAHLSLWWDDVKGPWPHRPPLGRDIDVDVCIVGAGFTGLWTAYHLAERDPGLRIAVVEREVAGFGASGRNGGWCSALFATSDAALARLYGVGAMRAMRRAMQHSVDAVGDTARAEGIDCHFAKGGTVVAARSPAQLGRARDEIATARALGFGEDDLRFMEADEARSQLGIDGLLGPPSPRIARPSNRPSWLVVSPTPSSAAVSASTRAPRSPTSWGPRAPAGPSSRRMGARCAAKWSCAAWRRGPRPCPGCGAPSPRCTP